MSSAAQLCQHSHSGGGYICMHTVYGQHYQAWQHRHQKDNTKAALRHKHIVQLCTSACCMMLGVTPYGQDSCCALNMHYFGGEVVTSRYFHRKAVLSTLDRLGKTNTHTRKPAKDTPNNTILQKSFCVFVVFVQHRHGNCHIHRVQHNAFRTQAACSLHTSCTWVTPLSRAETLLYN